ncbi:MAG: type II toxin-antitoxin system RelB/DinJ family antitoxin [Prevotella sp.]|nr:type II toxin-antitoxin system RelB/DinJ family antitoxin [Prevotella sp.]MBR6493735.1 type II toxin-antitoxin system RelB/DinJ family antitoxin [Prevotella sp.]
MAQVSMTVRMDSQLKRNFDALCSQFGMSANAAMNIFANAVVVYRKIPFEIKAAEEDANDSFKKAFYALRESARKNGLQDMTLEEINEEIRLAREEMDRKKKAAV